MANVNPQFLKIIKNEKVNIFVNSILHLNAALEAGFQGQEIIFTASALNVKTMKYIEKLDVQLNVDSPGQLKQWQNLFPEKSIGIRCNIGDTVKPCSTHAGYFIGKDSRLGFTREEIQHIECKSKIKGLHLYVGTEIFDIDYFINCYQELTGIASVFQNLEYLNFGGGFGVSEDGKTRFTLSFFHVLMPYPITQIYEQFKKEDRLLYDGHWWNHPDYRYNQAAFKPRLMTAEQLSEATIKANKDFYSMGSIFHRLLDTRTNMRNLVNFMIYCRFNHVIRKTSV